jgi:hypothetical protein
VTQRSCVKFEPSFFLPFLVSVLFLLILLSFHDHVEVSTSRLDRARLGVWLCEKSVSAVVVGEVSHTKPLDRTHVLYSG